MSRQFFSLLAIAAVTVTLAQSPAAAAPAEVDCAEAKCIALTFDDGPGQHAGKLLDTLKRHNAKATFFLQGQYVKSRPAFAKRMAKEGHELGNHSYTHKDFTKISASAMRTEIQKTQDIVAKTTGVTPKLLRPPYGMTDLQTSDVAGELGMPQILWTGGSRDWESKNEEAIKKQVLSVAQPDGIILMHDWVEQTVTSMSAIVKTLQNKGYTLVTVSTLIKDKGVKAGDAYPLPAGWQN
ncbi:polysaccharide deacetylase family protein [Nonomuraea longicatena]|uniref:NodB homology domain-containing protein n=1 Tax=Nonomuraea longicatena TaxID=83682 RepID=A0ABP3Z422_9ACTN